MQAPRRQIIFKNGYLKRISSLSEEERFCERFFGTECIAPWLPAAFSPLEDISTVLMYHEDCRTE